MPLVEYSHLKYPVPPALDEVIGPGIVLGHIVWAPPIVPCAGALPEPTNATTTLLESVQLLPPTVYTTRRR